MNTPPNSGHLYCVESSWSMTQKKGKGVAVKLKQAAILCGAKKKMGATLKI